MADSPSLSGPLLILVMMIGTISKPGKRSENQPLPVRRFCRFPNGFLWESLDQARNPGQISRPDSRHENEPVFQRDSTDPPHVFPQGVQAGPDQIPGMKTSPFSSGTRLPGSLSAPASQPACPRQTASQAASQIYGCVPFGKAFDVDSIGFRPWSEMIPISFAVFYGCTF